jgi:hypothetical protein
MAPDKLSALQKRLMRVLASLNPPWTLTGGGALAGVYFGHRTSGDQEIRSGPVRTIVASQKGHRSSCCLLTERRTRIIESWLSD